MKHNRPIIKETKGAKDKPSYWLTKAAGALDNAVQLTGDKNTSIINYMEGRCDRLAVEYKEIGR